MSESSQSAEQMAMTSARLAEIAARLSADGIKNLAALFFALAKNPKSHGATSVSKLFSDGSVPQVFQLKAEDLAKFKSAAKEYGVLFSAIQDKTGDRDIDILVRMQDTPKINRILEKFGYGEPAWNMGKEEPEKKSVSQDPHETPLKTQENISNETVEPLEPLNFDDIPFPSDSDLPPLLKTPKEKPPALKAKTPVKEQVAKAKKIADKANQAVTVGKQLGKEKPPTPKTKNL